MNSLQIQLQLLENSAKNGLIFHVQQTSFFSFREIIPISLELDPEARCEFSDNYLAQRAVRHRKQIYTYYLIMWLLYVPKTAVQSTV